MGYFDEDDYSADLHTTGVITIGASLIGKINYAYDVDWIKTTLVAGTTYVFGISDDGEMVLNLSNGTQLMAGANGQTYAGPAFEYTPTTSGDYYLNVSYGYKQYTTSYTLTAAIKPPDAVPGNGTTTAVLGADATVHGSIDVAGDRDMYKFHAEAGKHYLFGWVSNDGAISSLTILDSNGRPTNSSMLEVAEAGDYYIAVTGNRAGEYDLKSFVRSDDYSANDTSPGQLQTGGQLNGSVEYAADTDRIYIDLQAGDIYTLTLSGNASSSLWLEFVLSDANGKFVDRIGDGDYSNAPRQLTFTAQTTGKYAIDISDWHASITKHHDYILTASGGTPDDYGDTTAKATAVALDSPVHGLNAHASDVDMLKLTLKAGVTYNLLLSPDPAHGSATATTASLSVTGADGTTSLAGGRDTVAFTPAADGDYYIAISSYTPTYYVFSASTAPDDWRANASGAGKLALNGSASGTLESYGDRDWFALDMSAGQTYGVTLQRPPGYNNTGLGYYSATVKIVDAQGNTLASASGDYSSTPLLSYTATANGKFYVEVSKSGGGYTLGATLVQQDDAGNTPASAAVMPAGATVNGALEVSSDLDYYKLSVTAGETYAIQLKDVVPNDSWRPSLEVTDKQGAYVRSNGDATLVTATSSGDIYFKISGNSGAPAIAYQLISTAFGADDYGAGLTSTTIGALAVGSAVRGVINYADDVDWFKVSLQAGVTYQFDVQGAVSSNGSSAIYDAPLTLFDSKHNLMTTSNAIRSGTTLGYTVMSSGDYYVQVKNKGSSTTFTDSYVLSAQAIPAKPQLLTSTSGEAGLHQLTDKIVLNFNEALRLIGDNKIKLVDEAGNTYSIDQYKIGAGFNTTLVLPLPILHLKPGTTYKLSIESGALVNAAGIAFDGLQNYSITTTPFATSGSDGNDLLLGQHNGAPLNGGAGIDTVLYKDGDFFYRILRNGDHFDVTKQFGTQTSDTLVGVERVLFDDAAYALDIDGHGGQAYRLYQAAFDRKPDLPGLGLWIKFLDNGMSLAQVADRFLTSAEFIARNGSTSVDDAAFVKLMYNNVLHREPEAAGQQHWLEVLHNNVNRAEVLVSFSESAENQAALIGVIGNGFEYTPYGG